MVKKVGRLINIDKAAFFFWSKRLVVGQKIAGN
jgi:hypothetical protein